MTFDLMIFLITTFIALCGALYLWLNRIKSQIAGTNIKCGQLVTMHADGKVYPATQFDSTIGICIEEQVTP